MAISRRSVLLAAAGGVGVMGAATAISSRRTGTASGLRIAVVGAGLSGLQAAQSLRAAGCAVTVLEARDRIGGRVHTSRIWSDLPVDLGASWVHGDDGNPLMKLARAAGTATHPTSYDRSETLIGSAARSAGLRTLDRAAIARARAAAERVAERSRQDLSLAQAVAELKLDPLTALQVGFDLESNHVLEYGAPASRLSAWYGDAKGWPGRDLLFPGGFDQLIRLLADGLTIRRNQTVTAVRHDAGGVAITTRGGGVERFDAAVITLPLGVLQAHQVAFDPPLSPGKQAAIGRLGMGVLDKLWLRFDRVAWPAAADWFEHVSVPPQNWAQWVSLAPYRGTPVLLGFAGGDEAERLEQLDEAAVRDSAVMALRDMFGSAFPAPVAAQWTRWRADPHSRGGYSYPAVGSTPADRQALAAGEGRVAFAGEACHSEQWGTAHGALLSGRKAARDILTVLGA